MRSKMQITRNVVLHVIEVQVMSITTLEVSGKISPYGTDFKMEIVPDNRLEQDKLFDAIHNRKDIKITLDIE